MARRKSTTQNDCCSGKDCECSCITIKLLGLAWKYADKAEKQSQGNQYVVEAQIFAFAVVVGFSYCIEHWKGVSY
jgi:hypothetical protein